MKSPPFDIPNIVDVHIHPHYPDKPLGARHMADLMTAQMDRFGVQISGILGHVSPFQTEDNIREWNTFTIETVKEEPRRLFGMCYIDPSLPRSFVQEELDRTLSCPEMRGIKLEIDVNSRDARLDVVMEKAIEYDVPVLHHSWYVNLWSLTKEHRHYQKGRSEPHDIANLAKRFPQAKILMAHMEGSGIRGLLDVADCPNVWVDTSGSQPFTGTLEYAVECLGPERLIFGTDRFGRGFASQMGRILGAAISDADKKQILSTSAFHLYKLAELQG